MDPLNRPRKGKGKGKANQKVASILLKIRERVAYGWALIATRGFRTCQNPYGNTSRQKFGNYRVNLKASEISTVFEITQKAVKLRYRDFFTGS